MKIIFCMVQRKEKHIEQKTVCVPFYDLVKPRKCFTFKNYIRVRTLVCCVIRAHVTSSCDVTVNHIKCDPG